MVMAHSWLVWAGLVGYSVPRAGYLGSQAVWLTCQAKIT